MAVPPIDQRTFAFIVKIWWERRDVEQAAPVWRGSVEDVQSGRRVYFGSLPELCAYLEQRAPTYEAPSGWRAWLRRLLQR